MCRERNLFFFTVLLVNVFIVESRNQDIHSATVKTKVTRRDLLVQRNDPEHVRWRNDSSTATITCQRNNAMIISGSLLKLSEIPQKLHRKCNGTEPKIIELFATEKVIIDEDVIESGEQLTFIIIAPTWEVVGSRKIMLDGSSGGKHHQTKAENGFAQGGYDGANGKPGLPGGRGGNFYGFGETFINVENLSISANGGNGGFGQDGGDGADGIDAPTYQFKESLDGLEDPQYRVESTINNFDPLGTTTTHYIVHGQNGTVGGKGGDGGCGGKGGTSGEIVIYNLHDKERGPFFMGTALDGLDGSGGDGGKGGKGGCNARSVKFTHQNIHSWSYFSPREEIKNGCARDGKNGMANENRLGLRLLNDFYPSLNIQSGVSDYKFFAMRYLVDSRDDAKFRDFYNSLLILETLKNWISVFGFQVELYYIEYLYTYSENKSLLIPFVRSLKQRIQKVVKNPEVFFNTFQVQDLEIPHQFHSDFYNHLLEGCKWVEPGDAPEFVKTFQYKRELEGLKESVKNTFLKINSILSEEIEGKIDELKRKADEEVERLITKPSPLNDDKERREELKNELFKRFALESIRFANLALQFTNIKVFVNSMLKLNNEPELRLFADTDFAQFIFPRNVQVTYEEIQIKYKNYISKRVAIIKSHQAFVEEKKQFASYKEKKALDNLSSLLKELCKGLNSSNLIGFDPFLTEEVILLEEEKYFNILSIGSTNDSLVIQVIKHLKLHSLLGEIFGDSYERFANDNLADEIGKISFDFRNTDVYSKVIHMKDKLSARLLSEFDTNWIKMGMAGDKIQATKEINFDEVKSNFYSYLPKNTFDNFILAVDYLKEMQS